MVTFLKITLNLGSNVPKHKAEISKQDLITHILNMPMKEFIDCQDMFDAKIDN